MRGGQALRATRGDLIESLQKVSHREEAPAGGSSGRLALPGHDRGMGRARAQAEAPLAGRGSDDRCGRAIPRA
jgi:hypothetical protein